MNNNKPIPLISIILCTYQGERFLQTQLDSLLKQSYPTVEIHIFDDASTDATQHIIRHYAALHSTISFHINTQRMGFVANFEQAIAYCLKQKTTHYIALCDQDDRWHTDKLSVSIKALTQLEQQYPQRPALVHCDLRLIDAEDQLIHPSFFARKHLHFPNKKAVTTLLGYNGVMGNTLLINRFLANICLPFPPQLTYHDYWISLVNELFGKRKTLQHPLIDYRIHSNNTSNNRQKKGGAIYQKIGRKKVELPFFSDQREPLIRYLLENYSDLTATDRALLLQFQRYLTVKMKRWEALLFLFQNGFLKKNGKHKLSVCFRLLIMSKPQH